MTKTEMQQAIDEAVEILNEAYTPESSRGDLAEAVGRVLNVLESGDDPASGDYEDDNRDNESDDLD